MYKILFKFVATLYKNLYNFVYKLYKTLYKFPFEKTATELGKMRDNRYIPLFSNVLNRERKAGFAGMKMQGFGEQAKGHVSRFVGPF